MEDGRIDEDVAHLAACLKGGVSVHGKVSLNGGELEADGANTAVEGIMDGEVMILGNAKIK